MIWTKLILMTLVIISANFIGCDTVADPAVSNTVKFYKCPNL